MEVQIKISIKAFSLLFTLLIVLGLMTGCSRDYGDTSSDVLSSDNDGTTSTSTTGADSTDAGSSDDTTTRTFDVVGIATNNQTSATTNNSDNVHKATTINKDSGSKTSTATSTKKTKPTGAELKGGAGMKESYLSNAYKHITKGSRKLTIGYFGGSITLGTSAKSDGTMADSWANLTTSWFEEKYPDATIESVNAGVSDTATNFGLFRLEQSLMNENGHEMPDVVFVEFCTNDWIYPNQDIAHLKGQIESLFRNIYALNPYAEIVVVSTARNLNNIHRAYSEVAKEYDIPVLKVGIALTRAINKSGHTESNGDFYYTTDNTHPSAKGYHVYFEEIKEFLEENLSELKLQSDLLYDYGSHMPAISTKYYINSPKIHLPESLSLNGQAILFPTPLTLTMFGTSKTQTSGLKLTSSMVYINGAATIETTFKGSVLGLMFQMKSNDITLTYSIDGGTEKIFAVNDGSFGFQRYDHPQVFMLNHDLGTGTHKLRITFPEGSSAYLAGILANDA